MYEVIEKFEDKDARRLVFGNRFMPFLIFFNILFILVLGVGAIMGVSIKGLNLEQPVLYSIVFLGLALLDWGLMPIKNVFILDRKTRDLRIIQTAPFGIRRKYDIKSSENPTLIGRKKIMAKIGNFPFRPFLYYQRDNQRKSVALFPWIFLWIDKINLYYKWNWSGKELIEVSEFLGIPLELE